MDARAGHTFVRRAARYLGTECRNKMVFLVFEWHVRVDSLDETARVQVKRSRAADVLKPPPHIVTALKASKLPAIARASVAAIESEIMDGTIDVEVLGVAKEGRSWPEGACSSSVSIL